MIRKLDGKWLIAHEQVSVPIDLESGRALLNPFQRFANSKHR